MSDISSILGNRGVLPTIEHNGLTFSCRYLDQRSKAAFEGWVKRQAWLALFSKKEFLEPAQFAEEEENLQTAMECGHYGYHGRICQAAQSTECGQLALASILFGISEDEMLFLAAEKRDDVSRLVEQQIRASLPVRKPVETNGAVAAPTTGTPATPATTEPVTAPNV